MSHFNNMPDFIAAALARHKEGKSLFQLAQWFDLEKLQVYMRGGPTYEHRDGEGDMQFVPAIIISNITVFPQYRKQGVFKTFLAELIENNKNDFKYLIVEQVMTPHLLEYLLKQNFKQIHTREYSYQLDLESLR